MSDIFRSDAEVCLERGCDGALVLVAHRLRHGADPDPLVAQQVQCVLHPALVAVLEDGVPEKRLEWREGFFQPAPGERHTRLVKLTPDQYRKTISDIFGPAIAVEGRFIEVVPRDEGLLAVGNGKVSAGPVGSSP